MTEAAFRDGLNAAAEYLLACDDYGDRHKAEEIRKLQPPASPPAEALPSQTSGAEAASDRTAEDVLRDLAMSLGVGGYNDIGDAPFDPEKFDRKIRDGIDILQAPLVEAWRRYLKLRSIGAAPNGTLHLQKGLVMVATNLDRWLDEYITTGLPPARSHAVELKGFGSSPEEAVADAVASDKSFQRILSKPASEPAGGGARVKPLEWRPAAGDDADRQDVEAPSVVGFYDVLMIHSAYRAVVTLANKVVVIASGLGFEEAKAAAQDDYETRIRSALSSPASSSPAEAEVLPAGVGHGCPLSDIDMHISKAERNEYAFSAVSLQRLREWRENYNRLYYGPLPEWLPSLSSAPAQEDGA